MTTVDYAATLPARRRLGWLTWMLLVLCGIAITTVVLISIGVMPPISGFIAVAMVLFTLFWKIRAHLPSILFVFVSVLLLSVVITQRLPKFRSDRIEAGEGARLSERWQGSGAFKRDLPIVLHLVFDEMMSVGAMTEDIPGAEKTRQALLDFGEKHAFRTFGSVYSRYYYTSEALPEMMNREYQGKTGLDTFQPIRFNDRKRSYAVVSNAYFDDLARRGYRTAVFQTTYIDFCANKNVDLCETFDSFDPGDALDSPTQRVNLWKTVLRAYQPSYSSEVAERVLGRVYGIEQGDVGVIGDAERYDVRRFPQWFDRFMRFAATVPRGTHVFAHFLVPHSPYLLRENCVLGGKIEPVYELSRFPPAEQAARRRAFYERYYAQVRCVQSKLDDLMTAIGENDNFRDAVVIIHGDHGSRISIGDVLEDFTSTDYVDNYGVYFAVRAPNVEPGIDCEFTSLPEIFRRNAAQGVSASPRRGPPLPVIVLSRDAGNAKVESPMPRFGCGT